MVRLVYVENYGYWWKLSPDEWRVILEGGVKGDGHSLPDANALRRRSPLIGVFDPDDGMGKRSYYALRDDILVYSPLDWCQEDYRAALDELNAKMSMGFK